MNPESDTRIKHILRLNHLKEYISEHPADKPVRNNCVQQYNLPPYYFHYIVKIFPEWIFSLIRCLIWMLTCLARS